MPFDLNLNAYDGDTIFATTQSLLKIASTSASVALHFNQTEELKETAKMISSLTSISIIHSGFNLLVPSKGKATQSSSIEKGLKSAVTTTKLAKSVMSGMKVMESLDLISIQEISKTLGGTSVLGQTVSSVLSFGNVSTGLGVLTSSLIIVIEGLRIHEREQKKEQAKIKQVFWLNPQNLDIIQAKEKKQQNLEAVVNQKNDDYASLDQAYNVSAYENKIEAFRDAEGIKKFSIWISMKIEGISYRNWIQLKTNKKNEIVQIKEKEDANFKNLNRWKKIEANWGQLSISEKTQIQDCLNAKQAKWESKSEKLNQEQNQAGFGISLKIVGLIVTIASFTIGVLSVGLLPVLVTMSTLKLVLALTNLGFAFFKRHNAQVVVLKGVRVPRLLESLPILQPQPLPLHPQFF